MKTKNSFHRTPKHIADFVMSLCEDGSSFLDICAGDGALTNGYELKDLVSIDIDNSLLENIEQGNKVCIDFLTNSDVFYFDHYDYVLMNPPFDEYKKFVDLAMEVIENGNSTKGVFIIPKKAMYELDFNSIGMESATIFNQVDFGTAIVDIVVLKVLAGAIRTENKDNVLTSDEPVCAEFLNILSYKNFKLGSTYKGNFIHDSYTMASEMGLVEWRTDFEMDGDAYAVSTFFNEEHTPTLKEILSQIRDYISFWYEIFTLNKITFDNHDDFIIHTDAKLANEFMEIFGNDTTLEDYRKVTYRVYQDQKLFSLVDNETLRQLANVDFEF